ncbi:MAG: hypothetical protein R8F63_17915 [Acidimicrobiales bacterium]|nr:hypothetical protein [Acidimicrobiales bacterium]
MSWARRLRYELSAMAFVVLLAAVSVVATFGSARDGDLVFCRLVDGSVVVGVTTDCAAAVADGTITGMSQFPSRVSVIGPSSFDEPVEVRG